MEKREGRKEPVRTRAAETPAGSRPMKRRAPSEPEQGMDRYRIEVGLTHGVKPGNIVGAIANEADLSSEHIGRISIFDDHSTIDLPFGMPDDILRLLKKVRINERMLKISRLDSEPRQKYGQAADGQSKPVRLPPQPEGKKIRRKGQKKNMILSSPQF